MTHVSTTPQGTRVGAPRRLLAPASVAGLAIAVMVLVDEVDPGQPGHYPVCPFLSVTGWYCPGCGTLRALHALTRGEVATGFARNPMTMLTLPFLVAGWAAWVVREARGGGRTGTVPTWLPWLLAAGVLVFWVVRNLPGFAWLAP